MSINYGWYAVISDVTPLTTPISGLDAGTIMKVTAKENNIYPTRFFAAGSSNFINIDFADQAVDVNKGSSSITPLYNTGFTTTDLHSIEVEFGTNPGSGLPGFKFTIDGTDRGWKDAAGGDSSPWTVNALLSPVSGGKSGAISEGLIKNGAGQTVVHWDGNYVLNAAGTDFILRTDAIADPSLAESGFELKMYDTSSVSGNHVPLPAGTTWEFSGISTLPATVTAGQMGVAFTTTIGFTVTRVDWAGVDVPFTFNSSTGQGTFDAPALGAITGLSRFGDDVTAVLYNDTNSTQMTGTATWEPSAPYVYKNWLGNPDTTNMANAYYGWVDPPVAGDQAVYDPTNYTLSQNHDTQTPASSYYGRLVIEPDAPASFAVNEYIIDDGGMQEFERNSSGAAVIGATPEMTLNGPSSVTHTEGQPYTDQGATWTDAEDGTGTVYSSTVIDETTTPGSYTQTYTYTDADGNSVSRSRTVVVEAAPVQVIPTTTITTQPQTVAIGEQFTIQADTTNAASFSWACTSGQTPTIVDASAEDLVVTLNEAGAHTFQQTVTSSTDDKATASVTLTAADQTSPVITVDTTPIVIEYGSVFTPPAATAVDDQDGTVAVTVDNPVNTAVVGSYTVTYTAADAAQNTNTRTLSVQVVDTQAPTLTLIGDNPLLITEGGTFTDPGATLTDGYDATRTVYGTGSVDTSTPASYTITYNGSDTSGNAAPTITRTVNVMADYSDIVETVAQVSEWQVIGDGKIRAFTGRSNRETFKFIPSDAEGIMTTTGGYFDFSAPYFDKLEIHMNGEIIDTDMIAKSVIITESGDGVCARLGDFASNGQNNQGVLSFVLYVGGDTRGTVIGSQSLNSNNIKVTVSDI